MNTGTPTNVDGGTAILIVQLLFGIPIALFLTLLFSKAGNREE